MQRRGQSEQPTRVRRGKPKARKAATAHASTGDLRDQVAALSRELKDAREQQTATTEVLKVIAGSTGELESVFQAMWVKRCTCMRSKIRDAVSARERRDATFSLAWRTGAAR
jgi:hypothetical protein